MFLVDGTYELFRYFYGAPSHVNSQGCEVGAVRGVVGSILSLMDDGGPYVGVATDHVIESFRNAMWAGYKTGETVDPILKGEFGLLEEALGLLGVAVWAMVELEADDALASAAQIIAADPEVAQVIICTPDKDLAQCVEGNRVVQLDRRRRTVIDRDGVLAKFGVEPDSIPDYLALVGDTADGYPGLAGWGARSTAAVLARYRHLEAIPDEPGRWDVPIRGSMKLAATLAGERDLATLFRDLATLRREAQVCSSVGQLRWRGPGSGFSEFCEHQLGQRSLAGRAERLASRFA